MKRFFSKLGWMNSARSQVMGSKAQRRKQAALQMENLEGRLVLSGTAGGLGGLQGLVAQFTGAVTIPVVRRASAMGFGGGFGGGASAGVGTSSTLGQDAVKVNQAYQTFNSSILADVATLRQTATTTGAPTHGRLDRVQHGGRHGGHHPQLVDQHGDVEPDQHRRRDQLDDRRLHGHPADRDRERGDRPGQLDELVGPVARPRDRDLPADRLVAVHPGHPDRRADRDVTGTTVQTASKSVQTALQTFSTAITTAKQTAITNGTTLDSTAVSTAVTALQTSIDTAVTSLGTGFTASTYNPTTAINTLLTSLTTSLDGVTAPTAGSTSSARTFSMAINTILIQHPDAGHAARRDRDQQLQHSLL